MDITPNTGWNSSENAKAYAKYAAIFSMFKETSSDLLDFADVSDGMSTLDLACGTGITTAEAVKRVGSSGKVYAVDSSQAMLDEAENYVTAPNVNFLKAFSGELSIIMPEPVDRIVCNSAFWQFKADAALKAIRLVLKADGIFVFNLSSQAFGFPDDQNLGVSLSALIADVASKKYNIPTQNQTLQTQFFTNDSIKMLLSNNDFVLDQSQEMQYQRSADDLYRFYQIPIMTENLLPGLTYAQRMQILDEAYQGLDKNQPKLDRWMYFRAKIAI